MKLASISVVTVSLLACVVMGCSSGRSTPANDTGVRRMDAGMVVIPDTGTPGVDSGGPRDTGPLPRDTGTLPRDTGGTVRDTGATCNITCTSDSMCASSCGAVPGGGIRCCDRGTSRCFVSHAAACSSGGGDTGGMSY